MSEVQINRTTRKEVDLTEVTYKQRMAYIVHNKDNVRHHVVDPFLQFDTESFEDYEAALAYTVDFLKRITKK